MVLKSAIKSRIGQATGALAVDMETSAVAAVAGARNMGFLAVRCITDTSGEDLPEEFNDFFVVGQLQPSRIVAASVRRPRLVMGLARLGYRANLPVKISRDFWKSPSPGCSSHGASNST